MKNLPNEVWERRLPRAPRVALAEPLQVEVTHCAGSAERAPATLDALLAAHAGVPATPLLVVVTVHKEWWWRSPTLSEAAGPVRDAVLVWAGLEDRTASDLQLGWVERVGKDAPTTVRVWPVRWVEATATTWVATVGGALLLEAQRASPLRPGWSARASRRWPGDDLPPARHGALAREQLLSVHDAQHAALQLAGLLLGTGVAMPEEGEVR